MVVPTTHPWRNICQRCGNLRKGRRCSVCTYRTHSTYLKHRRVLYRHKLDKAKFQELLVTQKGKCAVCKLIPASTLHVDHDHETDEVRGLLCSRCNTGIGMFQNNPHFLANAIKYLLQ